MPYGSSFEHRHCSLEFYVTCQTQMGDKVRICGNSQQAGNWNPVDGHKLFTDQNSYPVWKSTTPLLLKNAEKLLFKACILHPSGFQQWESKIPNREVQIQRHSIIKLSFNQRSQQTVEKKVKQIQCREGTFDIIEELSSSEESSLEFKTNYPIEDFFQHDERPRNDRNLSTDMSSNLFSGNDENEDLNQNQPNYQLNLPDYQLFQIDQDPIKAPQLVKAQSIRPSSKLGNQQNHDSEDLKKSQIKVRKCSKSRHDLRSQSGSKSKSKADEPKSSFMIRIPLFDKNKRVTNAKESLKEHSNQTKIQNQAYQKRGQKGRKRSSSDNDTDSDASNLIQYDTEDQYLDNRDNDVVIEGRHKPIVDV